MKTIWLSLVSVAALTACEVGATPSTPGGEASTVINPTAGLDTYPGSSNTDVIPDGDDTRTYFETDVPITTVYEHFHTQLGTQGWQRTNLENDDDEVEADYVREGRELELELEREANRYELEIDIDRNNGSYDLDDNDDDGNDSDDD